MTLKDISSSLYYIIRTLRETKNSNNEKRDCGKLIVKNSVPEKKSFELKRCSNMGSQINGEEGSL